MSRARATGSSAAATTAPVLDPGRGRTRTGSRWALARDDRRWPGPGPAITVFSYAPGRVGSHAEEMLTGFEEVLQVDGYTGYNRLTLATRTGGAPITLACCWAHDLVHHSDRGSQYMSIRYTERRAEAGIDPSVATGAGAAPPGPRSPFAVGDSSASARAETVIGLFETEVIRRCGPSRGLEAVAFATLDRVDWFTPRRLPEPIGNRPPAEAGRRCPDRKSTAAMAA